MEQVIYTGLAFGGASVASTDAYYATIAPGSILDQCEIDGKLLGIGGVVRASNGSRISCAARGRLSDRQGAYPSLRVTPPNGFEQVRQIHDAVELQLWRADEIPVPSSKRAHWSQSVFVPYDVIPTVPFSSGPPVGYQALRVPCPGRTTAFVWFTVPSIGPRSGPGAQMDWLFRLRRYGTGDRTENFAGSCHGNYEGVNTLPPIVSFVSANDSSLGPGEILLNGAEELEILLANNQNPNDGWWVSVELRD